LRERRRGAPRPYQVSIIPGVTLFPVNLKAFAFAGRHGLAAQATPAQNMQQDMQQEGCAFADLRS